jgi:hypothetical protein
VAPLLVIMGMLDTGLLTLRADVLVSWERVPLLLIATIYAVAVALSVSTGRPTLDYAFTLTGICYMLLGNAVRKLGPKSSAQIRGEY